MSFEECYDQADLIIRIYDDARKRAAVVQEGTTAGFDRRAAVLMGRGEGSSSSSSGRYEGGGAGEMITKMEGRGSFGSVNGNGQVSQVSFSVDSKNKPRRDFDRAPLTSFPPPPPFPSFLLPAT